MWGIVAILCFAIVVLLLAYRHDIKKRAVAEVENDINEVFYDDLYKLKKAHDTLRDPNVIKRMQQKYFRK